MEITDSAIIALFTGLVWTLINVVKFFISKFRKDNKNDNISSLFDPQNKKINELLEKINDLKNMHEVYNDDHIPAWYIPSKMLNLIRENNNYLNILLKDIYNIKDDQHLIIEKMLELIGSQKLMTERLGDLINILSKISR